MNFILPGEYRKPAERLFPKAGFGQGGFSRGQKPDIKAAAEFAKALGISAEYQRLLALEKNSADTKIFLQHFQNNLDLLIQKTWVDKTDERRKRKLQDEIPPFMETIENDDFSGALEKFAGILNELAYLFFGTQSEKDDFTEYTFRIDAQMGLFWWYGGKIAALGGGSLKDLAGKNNDRDIKFLWAVLLLGICYLTNF